MEITAFNETKDLLDWLEDARCHEEVTRDVLVKRVKRKWLPEQAISYPVIKGNLSGDSKQRRKAREEKMNHRAKMFLLAQEVRKKHDSGVEMVDIQQRYQLSKSQVEKFISKNEWYNLHWANSRVPESFKEIVENIKAAQTQGATS